MIVFSFEAIHWICCFTSFVWQQQFKLIACRFFSSPLYFLLIQFNSIQITLHLLVLFSLHLFHATRFTRWFGLWRACNIFILIHSCMHVFKVECVQSFASPWGTFNQSIERHEYESNGVAMTTTKTTQESSQLRFIAFPTKIRMLASLLAALNLI